MSLELEYHHAREIWRAMSRSLRGLVRIRADVQAIQHQRSWLKFWTRERLWLEGRKEAHRVAQVQSEAEGGRGGGSGGRRGGHRAALHAAARRGKEKAKTAPPPPPPPPPPAEQSPARE